ncbi:LPS export ABC transporter periplasmic protein LptC [bacterium]|nr:LPS export ABC transporter periplasmic protein LptC [bacterium]
MTKRGWNKIRHLELLYAALVISSGLPDIQINNFHLVEAKNQAKQMEITSPKASVYQEEQISVLESPEAKVWGQNENPYTILANEGIIQTKTQDMTLQKNCTVTSPDGTVFQSENLFFDNKKGYLTSDEDVVASRKADQLSDTIEMTGKGLLIDMNTDVYHVLSNVRAQRRGKDKNDLRIFSKKSSIYPNRNKAIFMGTVRVYGQNMELNGDKLTAHLGNQKGNAGLDNLELEADNEGNRKITAKLEKITLYSKAVKIKFDKKGNFSQLEADGAVDAVTSDKIKMRSENLVYKIVDGKEKVLLKDSVEIQTTDRTAKCQEAEYFPDTGEIVLSRVATVKKGDQILRGEKIRFSIKNSQVFVEKASGEMLRQNLGF